MQSQVRIEMSQMHDAGEVLGEIFECMHRAELGREAAGEDPQLPRRVPVRPACVLEFALASRMIAWRLAALLFSAGRRPGKTHGCSARAGATSALCCCLFMLHNDVL